MLKLHVRLTSSSSSSSLTVKQKPARRQNKSFQRKFSKVRNDRELCILSRCVEIKTLQMHNKSSFTLQNCSNRQITSYLNHLLGIVGTLKAYILIKMSINMFYIRVTTAETSTKSGNTLYRDNLRWCDFLVVLPQLHEMSVRPTLSFWCLRSAQRTSN